MLARVQKLMKEGGEQILFRLMARDADDLPVKITKASVIVRELSEEDDVIFFLSHRHELGEVGRISHTTPG